MARVAPADMVNHVLDQRAKNLRLRVIVRADRDADYGAMEDLMNALQEARATRFVLMTEGEGPGTGGESRDLPGDDEEHGAGADLGSLHGGTAANVVRVASRGAAAPGERGATWAQ
jgi:hypothetical protein